jgi:hypothetical protein
MSERTKRHGSTTDIPSSILLKGEAWQKLSKRGQEEVVEEGFQYWRKKGFPYYRLSASELEQDFTRVLNHGWDRVFKNKRLTCSTAGLRLANAYQRGMWTARVSRYLSPMDVFRSDDLLRKAIRRAFRIWPTRYGANASSLRRMLKSFPSAAGVSNYRPAIARAVIGKFAPEGGAVVDFAAGYGGRLLGAIAANRNYVGIEPNKRQILGFRRMQRAIRAQRFVCPQARFLHGPAEHHLPRLPGRSADLVFSSPPFFDWERYSSGAMQSFRRYPTYERWRAEFLAPVIFHSFRILRKKGFLVLNVTNGNRRPGPLEVQAIAKASGFTLKDTYRMAFPKIPYLHPRNGNAIKHELLVVFQK